MINGSELLWTGYRANGLIVGRGSSRVENQSDFLVGMAGKAIPITLKFPISPRIEREIFPGFRVTGSEKEWASLHAGLIGRSKWENRDRKALGRFWRRASSCTTGTGSESLSRLCPARDFEKHG